MKKMFYVSLMFVGFGANAMNNNTQLATIGSNQLSAATGQSSGVAVVRSSGNVNSTSQEVFQFEGLRNVNGDQVTISLGRGLEQNGIFVRGNGAPEERTYQCTREFLNLQPADANHSFAVYRLSADTQELGNITISNNYVDRGNLLEHQTRTRVVDDDVMLRTTRTTQTYVNLNGTEIRVGDDSENTTPYAYTDRTEDRWYDDVHDHRYTMRDYVNSAGRVISKIWDDLGLIVKRPPANPTTTPNTQSGSTTHHSGPSNEVKRFIRFLGGI